MECPERDKIYDWTVKKDNKPSEAWNEERLEKLSKQKLKMVSHVWNEARARFVVAASIHSINPLINSLFFAPISRQIADKWRLFTVRSGTTEKPLTHSFYCHRLDCVMRCKFHFYACVQWRQSPGDSTQFPLITVLLLISACFSDGERNRER